MARKTKKKRCTCYRLRRDDFKPGETRSCKKHNIAATEGLAAYKAYVRSLGQHARPRP